METLKSQNILPNINAGDFPRAHTSVYKQTIDNPRDHDLKRRQTLWSFQHKNRGVQGKFKGIENVNPLGTDNQEENSTAADDTRGKGSKRFHFPKLKQKVKTEVNLASSSDETGSVKREYSSALRIGNTLYEQLRIKQNLDQRPTFNKHRPMLKSLDKFPEVSTSLTKLGYLKAAKNVVHYGGGFFGRNSYVDKRYLDFRRSLTTVNTSELKTSAKAEAPLQRKQYHGSLQQLQSTDISKLKVVSMEATETMKDHEMFTSLENDIDNVVANHVVQDHLHDINGNAFEENIAMEYSPTKTISENENGDKSKKSKEQIIELEMLSQKYSINFEKSDLEDTQAQKMKDENLSCEHTRRNEAWQKDIDMIVAAKHENENQDRPDHQSNSKTTTLKSRKSKTMLTKGCQTGQSDSDGRPESNVSLDIPEDQFGPSSYRPDDSSNRLLNPAYCINPYKWTSRSTFTEGDRMWVEKAMEKTEIIDTTIYEVFARKKSKSTMKSSEQMVKEKSSLSSKPP